MNLYFNVKTYRNNVVWGEDVSIFFLSLNSDRISSGEYGRRRMIAYF